MTREEALKIIHETIYRYFDVCDDDEETPMSDKDKLLLEINKSICNKIKENWRMVQPEPLTDKEQRIFLVAMGREEKICEEVDKNYVREPYEDSLMPVCKEIIRKVKGALWT